MANMQTMKMLTVLALLTAAVAAGAQTAAKGGDKPTWPGNCGVDFDNGKHQ